MLRLFLARFALEKPRNMNLKNQFLSIEISIVTSSPSARAGRRNNFEGVHQCTGDLQLQFEVYCDTYY